MYHSGNQLIDPKQLFEKVQLRAGMHIADFGCGRTGNVILPASKEVGLHGIIYAVDIMKDVLDGVIKRAHMHNLSNIHTVWSDVEQIGKTAIPEKSLDLVFFINSMFHMKNKDAALQEASRLLKNKARIMIVDWIENNLPIGPKKDQLVNFMEIIHWAGQNGFAIQEQFEAGQYHHGVILYKNQ